MIDPSERVILDLCGGSGSWSKPYKDAGYKVINLTLPEYSVNDWWAVGDNIRFRRNSPRNDGMSFLEVPVSSIYGILAAPPCTQFSVARTRAKIPRDYTGGMYTVQACLAIIWHVRTRSNSLKFWALENPRGHLRYFMGRPAFSFMQWEFGDVRDKPTDIWGYFNTPRKTHKQRSETQEEWGRERVQDGLDRAGVRAMTPPGFARAFYEANK